MFSKDLIMNLVRSGLKVAGTALAAKGIGDAASLELISGGIVASIGVIWSFVITKKTEKKLDQAGIPH